VDPNLWRDRWPTRDDRSSIDQGASWPGGRRGQPNPLSVAEPGKGSAWHAGFRRFPDLPLHPATRARIPPGAVHGL